MTEMIAAEPAIAERIVLAQAGADSQAGRLAGAIREALAAGQRITVTGCGTSEHAAQAAAEILRSAVGSRDIHPAQAFELALDPPPDGLVIAISHEGGTTATNRALEAARAAGARTALITVTGRSPGAVLADIVVETHELDQGWCHTVGYLSPIVAAAAIGSHLAGGPGDPAAVAVVARTLLDAGLRQAPVAERIAQRLAECSSLLVLASGADRPAGRELVLKIEEGTWMPAAYRDLETFLHGHLAATGQTVGLVLIQTDRRGRTERLARARGALAAARTVGMETAGIVSADVDRRLAPELTSAGRIVVPVAPDLPEPVAALIGTTTPLQLITERLARVRGVDPDPIHRDDERYRRAAEMAEVGEQAEPAGA